MRSPYQVQMPRVISANSPSLRTALFAVWYHRLVAPELVIRLFVKTHTHAVCAYAALVGLFGWLFGIAPYCCKVSESWRANIKIGENIPWPVILYVILLNLLNVVVALRKVHSLRVLPRKVSDETEWWQYQYHCPEAWVRKEALDYTNIFVGYVDLGGYDSVDGHQDEPKQHGARNS